MQLEKFFKKRQVPLDRKSIDAVINCETGAAIPLIETIYTFLTKREVKHIALPPAVTQSGNVPFYARATASSSLPRAENTSPERNNQVLSSHNEESRNEKLNEPDRFNYSRQVNAKPRAAVAPGDMSAMDAMQVQFKDVSVKTVEKNIAQVRASKEALSRSTNGGGRSALQSGGTLRSDGGASSSDMGGMSSMGGGAGHVKSVLSTLNTSVDVKCRGSEAAKSLDPRKDSILALMDSLALFPSTLIMAIAKDIGGKAALLADSMSASPVQFHKCTSALLPLLSVAPTSSSEVPSSTVTQADVFQAAVDMFTELGRACISVDKNATEAYWSDFLQLPLCRLLITASPTKQAALLQVAWSFVPNEAMSHLHLIRSLQEVICLLHPSQGHDLFQRLIAHCLALEGPLSWSADSLDLYLYYVMLGLTASRPSLRLSALTMIPCLMHLERASNNGNNNNNAATDSATGSSATNGGGGNGGNASSLGARGIVALRTQCTNLLNADHVPMVRDCALPIAWLLAVLEEGGVIGTGREGESSATAVTPPPELSALTPQQMTVSLLTAAPLLDVSPQLLSWYWSLWSSTSSAIRQALMQQEQTPTDSTTPEVSGSLPTLSPSIPLGRPLWQVWDREIALSHLLTVVAGSGEALGNLEHYHLLWLWAILEGEEHAPCGLRPVMEEAWTKLHDFVYVALCDEALCHIAAKCILHFFSFAPEVTGSSMPTFCSTLQMVFAMGAPALCGREVLQLLEDLASKSDGLRREVANMLLNLKSDIPALSDLAQRLVR